MNYVFAGDSITCADRLWNPGPDGLGNGYVALLAEQIRQRDPQAVIYNKGYDGFTLPFLLRNQMEDVIARTPDLVCILIGINDIGIWMNTGKTLQEQQFEKQYRDYLQQLRAHTDARIFCVAPFIFPYPAEFSAWIPAVHQAEQIIARAAQAYGASVLLPHERLQLAAAREGYPAITVDGIHLTGRGHRLLAEVIWAMLPQVPLV